MKHTYKKREDEKWTDKYKLGHDYVSFEDTISADFYEREREAVFRPSWLYVGRVERLPRPGSYYTKEITILDASLLITRDASGEVRVFHNVCPHRGNKLVWDTYADREVSGKCSRFFCKFHGISFELNGDLAHLTESKAWLDDQGSKLHLKQVPHEVWNGFIFVNLNPGGPKQSFKEFLGEEFWSGFGGYDYGEMTEEYAFCAYADANWKLMMDGFAEVYHAATTHHLTRPIDPPESGDPAYPVEFWAVRGNHRQYVSLRPQGQRATFNYERMTYRASDAITLPKMANPTGTGNWGTSSTIFWPNFYLQFYYPGWYATYAMWPLAYNKMRFDVSLHFPPSKTFSELVSVKGIISSFLEAAIQDFSLLEATQQGLKTRAFDKYPLTDEEICVRDFHIKINDAVKNHEKNNG